MEYLTTQEIIALNQQLITISGEGSKGIQYPEGLEMVATQPQMVVFGHELYQGVWLKAALILQKITKKNIFSDGSKRTAFAAAALFLMKNGYHLKVTKDEGIALMMGVTNSTDSEKIMLQVANFLKEHSFPISKS